MMLQLPMDGLQGDAERAEDQVQEHHDCNDRWLSWQSKETED